VSFVDLLKPQDVVDARTFADYVRQILGTPTNTMKDLVTLQKKLKEHQEAWPNADWQTLVRTVDWCKARKKRPARAFLVVDWVRYAWADGYLPELDTKPVDQQLEEAISEALEVETDTEWRYRLIGAEGRARKEVYVAWKTAQMSSNSL
jgi:hypothetical protein